MGSVKRAMEDAHSHGYWPLDGEVCDECILDGDLKAVHSQHLRDGSCHYCGTDDVRVAPASIIQEHIMDCLLESYEQLDDASVPYNGREGGYLIDHDSGYEIVSGEVGCAVGDEFLEGLAQAAADSEWVKRDWAILHPFDRLKGGWSGFCHTVRHHLRFSFAFEPETEEGHPDSTSPLGTLEEIGHVVESFGLIRMVPAGTEVIRVRVDASSRYSGIDELGAPPHRYAKANRMSPAGISMFYGALDYDTAVKETWDGKKAAVCSKATFRTKQDLRVVDFTQLPAVPGYWSKPGRNRLAALRFLHDLVKDFSQPVDRNTSVDLHYTPTQVVAEYLLKARHLVAPARGGAVPDPVHGISFASSYTGDPNLALNLYHASDRNLGNNIQDDWLELVKSEHLPLIP